MKYALGDHRVQADPDSWIAPNAIAIGKVILKKGASVWWSSVIRGDNVSVGHMCMLHGCEVGDESLIGIGAVVLTGAKIGKHCIIGANSLVPEHKVIPDNSLVFGSPGKVVRQVEERHIVMIQNTAKHYAARWRRYVKELREDGV
jgi:carbonic anhydrase/acetyltransferase-like protein (isoleucine patch superfamily)